jgi:hypothetical protein
MLATTIFPILIPWFLNHHQATCLVPFAGLIVLDEDIAGHPKAFDLRPQMRRDAHTDTEHSTWSYRQSSVVLRRGWQSIHCDGKRDARIKR